MVGRPSGGDTRTGEGSEPGGVPALPRPSLTPLLPSCLRAVATATVGICDWSGAGHVVGAAGLGNYISQHAPRVVSRDTGTETGPGVGLVFLLSPFPYVSLA